MKKVLSFFILLAFSLSVCAEMVSEADALAVANNFMNAPVMNSAGHRVARAPRQFATMRQQVINNQQFYVFHSTDESGFIIVSADDIARPILGYSDEGALENIEDNENLKSWLNSYNQEILWAKENGITQSNETQALWAQVSQNTTANVVVAPLLQTNWDQGCYYNECCPSNLFSYITGACGHVYAGCVACAMAQVMKYWNYPQQGTGSHTNTVNSTYGNLTANFGNTTYAWSNMPNQLTSSSSNTQVNAVSTLMYHCGVSIDMDYGFNGSGVSDLDVIPTALINYFGYNNRATAMRKSNKTNSEWLDILTSQLDHGYPIIYAGFPTNGDGHCFVCDGYKEDNAFHFNFGWNGSGNGYFYLNAVTPGSGHNYSYNQCAVVNAIPMANEAIDYYAIQPGRYLILTERPSDGHMWFMSSDLGTASNKRFQADTIADKYYHVDINTDSRFVWDVEKNANGSYYIKNGNKYVSWTSGNTATLSTTPKELQIVWDEASQSYNVFFNVSSGVTRYLSLNASSAYNYFAFYLGKDQLPGLQFMEYHEEPLTTIRTMLPADWNNTISAWVWYNGEVGRWETLTRDGDWYKYSDIADYNIIFVNGTNWNGDNNQTVDIAVSGDMCIVIDSNTSGKRTFGELDCDPEPFVPDCKTLPYSESFASNQGEFTIENVALDGLGYVWTFASGYGMKASAYVSSVNHPTESWLISPCMEFPEGATINLTFDHVYRYTTTPTTDLTLLVSEDYESGAPSTATWTPVTIPTYSSGSNWTFVNAGNINLSAYAGKYITLAFRYKSSSTAAATWEIKNVSVTADGTATGLDAVLDSHNATKCIIDGRLVIFRDGHKFSATGTMIE